MSLKNKFLFLDTNLLIILEDLSEHPGFALFFDILKKNNLKPLINAVVEFEYLRSANTKKELEKRKEFLTLLLSNEPVIPFNPDIHKDALSIGNVYSHIQGNLNKQISMADCYIASFMKKYTTTSALATSDLNDFPLEIFDRISVLALDGGKNKVSTIGFYEFNIAHYEMYKKRFDTH